MTTFNSTAAVAPPPAIEDGPILELDGVSAGYGSTTVLRDVSLRVAAGSVTALLGPNGAGKTTTLRLASGLMKPTAGRIRLYGNDVTRVASHRRIRSGLCHVPEGRGVYRNLTVRENLQMQTAGKDGKDKKDSVELATSTFPILGKRLNQLAGTMSGGEQQMLALSVAYLSKPRVVLVDEPSLGLAPVVVDAVFDALRTLCSTGVALLLVDQFALRALDLADHAYVLRRGSIVYDGSPDALLDGNMFEKYVGETE